MYEASYRARLKPPIPVGLTPFGNRMWFEVIDGVIEGERLNGVLTSGGGDWLLAGPDGYEGHTLPGLVVEYDVYRVT